MTDTNTSAGSFRMAKVFRGWKSPKLLERGEVLKRKRNLINISIYFKI